MKKLVLLLLILIHLASSVVIYNETFTGQSGQSNPNWRYWGEPPGTIDIGVGLPAPSLRGNGNGWYTSGAVLNNTSYALDFQNFSYIISFSFMKSSSLRTGGFYISNSSDFKMQDIAPEPPQVTPFYIGQIAEGSDMEIFFLLRNSTGGTINSTGTGNRNNVWANYSLEIISPQNTLIFRWTNSSGTFNQTYNLSLSDIWNTRRNNSRWWIVVFGHDPPFWYDNIVIDSYESIYANITPSIANSTSNLSFFCGGNFIVPTNATFSYIVWKNNQINATGTYNIFNNSFYINVHNVSAPLVRNDVWKLTCNLTSPSNIVRERIITIQNLPPFSPNITAQPHQGDNLIVNCSVMEYDTGNDITEVELVRNVSSIATMLYNQTNSTHFVAVFNVTNISKADSISMYCRFKDGGGLEANSTQINVPLSWVSITAEILPAVPNSASNIEFICRVNSTRYSVNASFNYTIFRNYVLNVSGAYTDIPTNNSITVFSILPPTKKGVLWYIDCSLYSPGTTSSFAFVSVQNSPPISPKILLVSNQIGDIKIDCEVTDYDGGTDIKSASLILNISASTQQMYNTTNETSFFARYNVMHVPSNIRQFSAHCSFTDTDNQQINSSVISVFLIEPSGGAALPPRIIDYTNYTNYTAASALGPKTEPIDLKQIKKWLIQKTWGINNYIIISAVTIFFSVYMFSKRRPGIGFLLFVATAIMVGFVIK